MTHATPRCRDCNCPLPDHDPNCTPNPFRYYIEHFANGERAVWLAQQGGDKLLATFYADGLDCCGIRGMFDSLSSAADSKNQLAEIASLLRLERNDEDGEEPWLLSSDGGDIACISVADAVKEYLKLCENTLAHSNSHRMEQKFHEEAANRLVPQGCSCPDDSGSCEWCHVYYCGEAEESRTAKATDCYFCGRETVGEDWCYGCAQYICGRCDLGVQRDKHKPEEHRPASKREERLAEALHEAVGRVESANADCDADIPKEEIAEWRGLFAEIKGGA